MTGSKPTREQVQFYNLFTRYVRDDGTILSGKHSEMNLGSDPKTIKTVFESYWDDASDATPASVSNE